jgi:hypothetical protein
MSRKVGSVVNYVVPHLTRCCQKFRGNNHGDQELNFGPQNSLNLIYAHLQFKKFSGGYTPGHPLKGGREGEGKEIEGRGRGRWGMGKRGKGEGMYRSAPLFQILDTPLITGQVPACSPFIQTLKLCHTKWKIWDEEDPKSKPQKYWFRLRSSSNRSNRQQSNRRWKGHEILRAGWRLQARHGESRVLPSYRIINEADVITNVRMAARM